MLTFYIGRVSLRAVYRTALARQSAPGWPCHGHAREGFKFAFGFCSTFRWGQRTAVTLTLGQTLTAARPLTSSCILTCFNLRNTLPRCLSKLQTSPAHTTKRVWFISLFSAIYSHVPALHVLRFHLLPAHPSVTSGVTIRCKGARTICDFRRKGWEMAGEDAALRPSGEMLQATDWQFVWCLFILMFVKHAWCTV